MKSKLTDEDIPDLADLLGELCSAVYSDNVLLQGNASCRSIACTSIPNFTAMIILPFDLQPLFKCMN